MKLRWITCCLLAGCFLLETNASSPPMDMVAEPAQEPSAARVWMEVLLEAIQWEEGRPTIHARNIFHTAIAMYDAWAVYDDKASPYLLGNTVGAFSSAFDPDFDIPQGNQDSLQSIAVHYAAYRIIYYRFELYSSKSRTLETIQDKFRDLGFDHRNTATDYQNGSPEALGNYIAEQVIQYGDQDGSHEVDLYESYAYEPVNPSLKPHLPGNPTLRNPNRWQPISVREYVEQKGMEEDLYAWNFLSVLSQDQFLNPEWGEVQPFALNENDRHIYTDRGPENKVYLDPGPPPLLAYDKDSLLSASYKWGFLLNALWASQLDPADSVKWNISPGVWGNPAPLPDIYADFPQFYQLQDGGVQTQGHPQNPYTHEPYAPNWVLRGDYTRVIAEYWVDGVNTATPPGHWLKTLHYVADHPLFERKWKGKGRELDPLAWDVKAYLVMGGAMHDAAIAAWSVKGYYDYIRPISAIRFMADRGQCTDPQLPHFHREGLPLIPGYIELVDKKDPLVGPDREHLHKLKIRCWRGPEYVADPQTDHAGVGWILAENWWPYQRYSFATPPFAGYVSGHSTFSLAGAEVLTQLTGDAFFPGGLAEFEAKAHAFLAFEDGPSQDLRLQWATYYDAANETCLSRLWGGIHPPADDIPARKMGLVIGDKAMQKAQKLFDGKR